MCGFVAVWRDRRRGPVREEELRALLPDLRHRGPDGEGVVVRGQTGIAATRLAIQGGSQADQPFAAPDGSFHLAFNGEVLATEAARLRARLGERGVPLPPAGAGDTPLVAAAHAGRLAGGSVLDGAMGAVVVASDDGIDVWADDLGVKTCATAAVAGGAEWWAASEATPLLRRLPALRRASAPGLARLYRHHWAPGTPFEGLGRAAPGTLGVGPDAGRSAEEPRRPEVGPLPDGEPPARLREALGRAAREAAAVAEPVGVFLSGGLDSSAVAALADRPDLIAFTGRFAPRGGPFDESDLAAETARRLGLRHVVVDLRDEDLLADLPDVIRALEMPVAGPGALALWRLARAARREVRVVLTGTGGDELLGGYARTALALGRAGPWTEGYDPLRRRMEAAGPDPRARWRAAVDRRDDLRPFLSADLRATLPEVEPFDAPLGSDAAWLAEAERAETLPALLHVEDRVTMAHGIEGRPVPCLGDVPGVARRLPPEWLVGPDGEGKRALREALRGRVPEAVRTDRRKRGFPTPFARAARGAGRPLAEQILHDRRFVERGWWDVAACRRALDEPRPDHDRGLYALLSWELWARLFLDGDAFRGEPGRA